MGRKYKMAKTASVFAEIIAKRYKQKGSPVQDLDDINNAELRQEVADLIRPSSTKNDKTE